MPLIGNIVFLLATYLLAAIPFGFLVGRLGGLDVRRHGSGNIGATNLLRTRGKGAAAVTLILDVAKGAIPVVAAGALFPEESWLPVAAAFVAVVGHCFPVYLRFQGGKGVATALGSFVVLDPLASGGAVLIFAAVVAATRLVALGSTLAGSAFPAIVWLTGAPELALGSIPTALVILWRHRENWSRIRAGTERRLGERSETS